jgi:hypothetical protein
MKDGVREDNTARTGKESPKTKRIAWGSRVDGGREEDGKGEACREKERKVTEATEATEERGDNGVSDHELNEYPRD